MQIGATSHGKTVCQVKDPHQGNVSPPMSACIGQRGAFRIKAMGRTTRPWLTALLVVAPVAALWAAPGSGDCVVRHLLGIDCPGCGLGRGLDALASGALASALLHYPPLPALAGGYLVAVAALWLGPRGEVGRAAAWTRLGTWSGATIAFALVGNWLARLL